MVNNDSKRLNDYADKLYNGILRRYKEQQAWKKFYVRAVKRERGNPTKSQRETVVHNSKQKCVICKEAYDEQCFEFHHVNGDNSYTVEKNLVLVCSNCHAKIHTKANNKLANHKVRVKRKIEHEPPKNKGKKTNSNKSRGKQQPGPLQISTDLDKWTHEALKNLFPNR